MSGINEPDGLEQPRSTNILWRYQSLDKFYHLLLERKLHFAQANRFSDKNEFELIVATHESNSRKRKRLTGKRNPADWDIGEQLEERVRKLKETTYVSTWSLGAHESYALWKIYLGGAKAGVAIRTSVANLQRSLQEQTQTISAAKVNYASKLEHKDVSDDLIICSKLQSYRYEAEYRLYFKHVQKQEMTFINFGQPAGINVKANLPDLIDRIYLSPFASSWFRTVFEKTIQKLAPDLEVKVRASIVRDE